MQTIYKPKGAALEYSDLALNLYRGCSHNCSYCYAPTILHMTRDEFSRPIPRPDILSALRNIAPQYAKQSIFLCFTSDCYQPIEVETLITRGTLVVFARYNIIPRILTKAGMRSTRDFDLLFETSALYGATLTFLDDKDSLLWEPNAALPGDRIAALKLAHKEGIYTWVSLEPVIDPMQTIELILTTKDFVDEYKVGKWNHDKRASKINWKEFYWNVTDVLKKTGKRYYIKDDLRKCL